MVPTQLLSGGTGAAIHSEGLHEAQTSSWALVLLAVTLSWLYGARHLAAWWLEAARRRDREKGDKS
jgi:hypothetical protein